VSVGVAGVCCGMLWCCILVGLLRQSSTCFTRVSKPSNVDLFGSCAIFKKSVTKYLKPHEATEAQHAGTAGAYCRVILRKYIKNR
jgi:hypothetical protein